MREVCCSAKCQSRFTSTIEAVARLVRGDPTLRCAKRLHDTNHMVDGGRVMTNIRRSRPVCADSDGMKRNSRRVAHGCAVEGSEERREWKGGGSRVSHGGSRSH